jgi:hypothetical protein
MDDQTLIKAFLKKQKEIQDDFLTRLNQYKAPVDTTELKKLVEDYKTAVYGAASIKPKLDTSTIDQTIKQAVTSAISTVSLSSLTDEVKTQARAIERNNSLLSNGTGWQLKFWVILLTLAFGFMAGWGVNWYFEIPAKIAGVRKYQTLQSWYDGINEMMKDNCQLAKAYYKARNLNPKDVQCGTLPLKTSQDLISGN